MPGGPYDPVYFTVVKKEKKKRRMLASGRAKEVVERWLHGYVGCLSPKPVTEGGNGAEGIGRRSGTSLKIQLLEGRVGGGGGLGEQAPEDSLGLLPPSPGLPSPFQVVSRVLYCALKWGTQNVPGALLRTWCSLSFNLHRNYKVGSIDTPIPQMSEETEAQEGEVTARV